MKKKNKTPISAFLFFMMSGRGKRLADSIKIYFFNTNSSIYIDKYIFIFFYRV